MKPKRVAACLCMAAEQEQGRFGAALDRHRDSYMWVEAFRTGTNSKRQPELATLWEKVGGQLYYLPFSTRLRMDGAEDRLALASNSFFSVLEIPRPSEREAQFRFAIHTKGRGAESALTLQLCLKGGQLLETGAGKMIVLGEQAVELGPEEIGGWIRHEGWTLRTDAAVGDFCNPIYEVLLKDLAAHSG